jgi:hypothetical protein
MTRTKDFGKGKNLDDFEPLEFTLAGETFQCRPALQGKFMLDMAANTGSDDPSSGAKAINGFFSRALLDGEYERFETLLNQSDVIITTDTLSEIVSWLVEEYAGRPTTPPTS